MKDEETRIADLKQRKVKKHFAAMVGSLKVQIVSFRIKTYKDRFESGKLLELVSKAKFPGLPETAIIRIERGTDKIHVKARRKGAIHALGVYTEKYLILEEIKD